MDALEWRWFLGLNYFTALCNFITNSLPFL